MARCPSSSSESLRCRARGRAPDGGRLLDICDDAHAPIPSFSCRSANCGICRIDVLEGLDQLEEPEDDEASVLAIFADPPTRRLACCAKIRPGMGRLRIRAVDEDLDDDAARRTSDTRDDGTRAVPR